LSASRILTLFEHRSQSVIDLCPSFLHILGKYLVVRIWFTRNLLTCQEMPHCTSLM